MSEIKTETSISYFTDSIYYPNWYIDNFGTSIDKITKDLLGFKFADRNATHMKYRGNSLRRDKVFFVDSLIDVPVYQYPGYQYKSIVNEYKLITENKLIQKIYLKLIEKFKVDLNHVIGTIYRDGKDIIGWHDDKVKSIDSKVPIFILSFGAQRPLSFRNKETEKFEVDIPMKPGSLFILGHQTNKDYQHSIQESHEIIGPRVSIIFRNIINKVKYETILKRANKT